MVDHTPGPWRFEENIPGPDGFPDDIVTDPRGFVIAEVSGESVGDGPAIAAAPDLLEACEAMLARIAERYTDDDFEKDVPLARAVEDMRAAIRKAKGEGA